CPQTGDRASISKCQGTSAGNRRVGWRSPWGGHRRAGRGFARSHSDGSGGRPKWSSLLQRRRLSCRSALGLADAGRNPSARDPASPIQASTCRGGKMKNSVIIALTIAVLLALASGTRAQVMMNTINTGGGVSVNGKGEVIAKPDVVEIKLRVAGTAELTDDAI